jgi:hypothetical protein
MPCAPTNTIVCAGDGAASEGGGGPMGMSVERAFQGCKGACGQLRTSILEAAGLRRWARGRGFPRSRPMDEPIAQKPPDLQLPRSNSAVQERYSRRGENCFGLLNPQGHMLWYALEAG